jgi:hypothetical protein
MMRTASVFFKSTSVRAASGLASFLTEDSKKYYDDSRRLLLQAKAFFEENKYEEAKKSINTAIEKTDLMDGPGVAIMGHILALTKFAEEVESACARAESLQKQ